MQVLIVDDDATSLLIASAVISQIGDVDPVTWSNPIDALRWLEQSMPDLIIVDQIMPDLNGTNVIRRIREMPHLADVPVVMITSDTSVDLRIAALECGCTDFLTKPIIVPELLARVRNLLALRAGQWQLIEQASTLRARVDEATVLLRLQANELVNRLARAAEFRDPETGLHLERMAAYARLIAERLGLDASLCNLIFQAAPMHDVGKIGIPDSILLKQGPLTGDEMNVMKRHADMGYAILRGSEHQLIRLAAEVARCHHEKFDGSGYPRGLSGGAIPLAARIVAVADVFDALTTARPYKRPWALEEARNHITAASGSHFDPTCVDAFVNGWNDVVEIYRSYPEPDSQTAS